MSDINLDFLYELETRTMQAMDKIAVNTSQGATIRMFYEEARNLRVAYEKQQQAIEELEEIIDRQNTYEIRERKFGHWLKKNHPSIVEKLKTLRNEYQDTSGEPTTVHCLVRIYEPKEQLCMYQ